MLPLGIAILAVLFVVQRFGTHRVGRLFGPLMVLWFVCIALIGIPKIVQYPGVLQALSPTYVVTFFADHPYISFMALGAVVLSITGAEALYADMGHFGRGPIRRAWFAVVFPALMLNYLGQGALILHDKAAAARPFFLLAPSWARLPMVVLATLATVIASQAVISGAFSMSRQAVRLGFLPHLTVRHTSTKESGQIYVPGRELVAVRRRRVADAHLPLVGAARDGVRARGDRHVDADHDAVPDRGEDVVELGAMAARRRRDGPSSASKSLISQRI